MRNLRRLERTSTHINECVCSEEGDDDDDVEEENEDDDHDLI